MAIENTYLTGSGVQLGTSHFDLQAQKPLDSRTTVPAFAGLQALIDGKAAYEGMIVYDEETKKTYQAQKVDGVLKFREFGINQAEINELIDARVIPAMEFMGAVTELPTGLTDADEGHFYKIAHGYKKPDDVVDTFENVTTGAEGSGENVEVCRIPVSDITKGVIGIEVTKAVDASGKLVYPKNLRWFVEGYDSSGNSTNLSYSVHLNEDGTKAYIYTPEEHEDYTASEYVLYAITSTPEGDGFVSEVSGNVINGYPLQTGDTAIWHNGAWEVISSGDDLNDTWRPVTDVRNDATLTFLAGDKLDVAVASNGNITYKHEAIDAPTDVTAEGDEQTRTYITAVETDGFGHITGYKTATENVEDTNTTYEFEGQSDEATSVYFQVTSSEEGATAEVIYLDAYSKNEADNKFVEKVTGKQLSTEDFTTELLNKLNGIAEGANKYEHATHTAYESGIYKVTVDAEGHISAAVAVTKDDIVALGIPGQDTTYEKATANADGLMSKEHFAKVEGISAGATKVENVGDGKIKIDGQEVTVYAHPDKHTIDDVTGLQDALNGKVDVVNGKGLSANDLTDELKGQYDTAYTHSQTAHAPANAQENVIESVKVNGTALTITGKAVDITVPTGALAGKDEVAKTDLAEALATEIDNKVASVAAGDKSVTVGGSATAPTVAVKLSAAEGNALTLADDGLKVIIPESTKVEKSETNGNIKVDGQEVTVYTHPESHTASEISDFATEVAKVKVNDAAKADEATKATQDGNGKVIADTYAEKATTLAGYGIGDAYTKTETYTQEEVNSAIATAVETAMSWGSF